MGRPSSPRGEKTDSNVCKTPPYSPEARSSRANTSTGARLVDVRAERRDVGLDLAEAADPVLGREALPRLPDRGRRQDDDGAHLDGAAVERREERARNSDALHELGVLERGLLRHAP